MAWLSLDASDADPASFWTYVVTALQAAVPGAATGAQDLIASTPLPTEQLLTTVLNDLAEASGQVWLVLDDYHLADGQDLRAGMTFLLDHLPPQAHVVISTRADPELPLSRWRMRGELVEIRASDLRFTAVSGFECDALSTASSNCSFASCSSASARSRLALASFGRHTLSPA